MSLTATSYSDARVRLGVSRPCFAACAKRLSPALAVWMCLLPLPTFAQKKPDPKDVPKLTFAEPFAVDAGRTTRLKVRGLKLDGVTEARCHDPKGSAKLIGKPVKVNAPNPMQLESHGDMQVEIELTLPNDAPQREVTLSVVGPGGESRPLRLLVNDGSPRIAEKEPNNGFRQAQVVTSGHVVEGTIQSQHDVDVFAIDGTAGMTLSAVGYASRYGSPAELLLTLFDGQGRTVWSSDDRGREQDPRLDLTLPRDGRYYLCVQEINDQGGAHFKYRLRIEIGGK